MEAEGHHMFKKHLGVMVLILGVFVSGCGYTTRSLLSPAYRSIYVDSFINKIKINAEQSDARMYRGYRPAMEAEVTRQIIDRFLFDGNLKVAERDEANLILTGELVDFRKEPLRYDANDNIEEYRLIIVVDIELKDAMTGKVLWEENGFSGESTYRTTGSLATTESAALDKSEEDLARRVVERTVEGW